MKQIAILGFGVVGAGIPAVLEANAADITRVVGDTVEVKYILDLREFPDSPYADRIVHDIAPILSDPDVAVVCEAMGGSHPALEYSLDCLKAGKSVVTSNKELVANYGDILLKTARENGVSYLFEASVGGGIPLIRPFTTSLAGDRITKIAGIVNGTTNYILTKMREDGRAFDDVLAEAQQLGYAERNPSADIDGIDAKRKIIILAALATGTLPSEDEVYAGTLRNITPEDIQAAEMLDGSLKLIARTEVLDEGLAVYVCPMIVRKPNPLVYVKGVYNAVSLTSPATGDIMYYGRGAGRLPTAGAIVSDVTAILSGAAAAEFSPEFRKKAGAVLPFEKIKFDFYIRANGSASETLEKLSAVCDSAEVIGERGGAAELIARGLDTATAEEILPDAVKIRILE